MANITTRQGKGSPLTHFEMDANLTNLNNGADNANKLGNKSLTGSGNYWGVVPYVGADGIMEVGKYIDFHRADNETHDFRPRLWASGTHTLETNGTMKATLFQGNGSLLTGMPKVPKFYNKVFPSDRQFTTGYDYHSSRNNDEASVTTYPYNMNRAKADGVISANDSGVSNWTSYHTTTWNYRFMYELAWLRDTSIKGMKIVVPADTDVVAVRGHGSAYQIFSLLDTGGSSPCSTGCTNDNRIYHTAGHGHSQGVGVFGERDVAHNHHTCWFSVPRLTFSKEYILIRGHHTQNRSEGGWVSGIAFNKNPNLFAKNDARDYYWATNGGNTTNWNTGNWNEHNLGELRNNQIKAFKVPVAPNNPDASSDTRMLYALVHAQNYNSMLQYLVVDGQKYSFSPDTSTIGQSIWNNTNETDSFAVISVEIPIPEAVRDNGGVVNVELNNDKYDQYWFYSEIGTFLKEGE